MDTFITPALPTGSPGMDLRAYCDHASKMRESSDIAKIAPALVRAQAALANPPRNRSVQVRTKTGNTYVFRYATLDRITEATRPALGQNGLCVLQPIVSTEKGQALVTRLLHESGQWMECEIPLPPLGQDPQGFGSAVSYLRRYAVSAMLNITADEDDDANTAAGNHVADAPRPAEDRRGPARPTPDNSAAPTRMQASQPAPTKAAHQAGEGSASPTSPRQPDATPPRTARPEPSANTQAPPPGTSGQAAEMPAKAAAAPRQAADATRRRKDEAAPPSAWAILRPGKATIRAPDGAAWLKWWTDIAAKAQAEGKLDELRTRCEANAATWDEIALASPETEAVVVQAAQTVRAALDG